MALNTTNADEVPKDAVILNEVEAAAYIWDHIYAWKPAKDTWALKYSVAVLGGLNSIAGVLINNHFRNKLKLGRFGHMSSLLPVSLLPGVFTALFHRHFVTIDLLLMKAESCPICYELRSAAIQLGFGIAYPMVLAPTSALMFANRYHTFRVPSLTAAPKELFKFVGKIAKPLSSTLTFLMIAQLFASSVLTHYEMRNHITVRKKMVAIEKELMKSSMKP